MKTIENELNSLTIDYPDRIKLNINFDESRLKKDVLALIPHLPIQNYVYYNTVPLRGSTLKEEFIHPKVDNLDYSNPELYIWQDNNEMDYCPYIKYILSTFDTKITNVRLMRLEAGGIVKEHTDPTLDICFRSVVRLTIPIFSDSGTTFLLDNKPVPMQPGELWYLQLSKPHAVVNKSKSERINLSIDLVVNDWLENQLIDVINRRTNSSII